MQKYTTHSISSTINLSNNTTPQVVAKIYSEAWKRGLKGITVYRDGSRTGVLVSNDEKQSNTQKIQTAPPKRPQTIEAEVLRFMNHDEMWIAVVGMVNGNPYEIFTGRAGVSF